MPQPPVLAIGTRVKIGFMPESFQEVEAILNEDGNAHLIRTNQGCTCWVQYLPASNMFTLISNHAHGGLNDRLNCTVCNPLREGLVLPPLKSRY